MSAVSQIALSAMLVRVQITQWTARKLDRKASKSAKDSNGATDKAGLRVYKSLVSAEALDSIGTVCNRARIEHRKRTVPWVYDGPGAIAAAGYADYIATMQALESEFDSAVASFVAGYAEYRNAARADLGDLFNESDYPAPEVIRDKFSFAVLAEQMPVANDFRVELGAGHAEKIRADIEKRFGDAMAGAMREAWERIADRVGHMAEKLRAYKPATGEGAKAEGVFRDSLVDNIKELVRLMPSLNITGDAELTRLSDRMERELCSVTAEALRNNTSERETVATAAESIMKDIWAKRRAARGASMATVEAPAIASDAAPVEAEHASA